MKVLGIYLLFINVAAIVLYGEDKRRARLGKWRIKEKTLFLAALAGGSLGAIMGMKLFRHKTRHRGFAWGIPVMLAVQSGLILWLYFRGYL